MIEINNNYYRKASKALFFGSTQFAFLTLIAMLTYPGGSGYNSDIPYYDFFHNFFSDLGATVSHSGAENRMSSFLFFLALNGLGFSMLVFFRCAEVFLQDNSENILLRSCSTFFVVVSGTSFMLVTFFPIDTEPVAHMVFARLSFGFLMLYVGTVSLMQWIGEWPKKYQAANFVYFIFVAGYVFTLLFGPPSTTVEGLLLQATAQKMVAYSSATNIAYQMYGILIHKQETGAAEIRAELEKPS